MANRSSSASNAPRKSRRLAGDDAYEPVSVPKNLRTFGSEFEPGYKAAYAPPIRVPLLRLLVDQPDMMTLFLPIMLAPQVVALNATCRELRAATQARVAVFFSQWWQKLQDKVGGSWDEWMQQEELDFVERGLNDDHAKVLAHLMRVSAVLTAINLLARCMFSTLESEANCIGEAGAKAFAEALKVNTRLKYLNLSNSSIGNEGAKAIADALRFNTVLEELFLYGNNIGDEGAKAITEALKDNTGLTLLDLRRNSAIAGAVLWALKTQTRPSLELLLYYHDY